MTYKAIGLMSGSSLDGLDIAFVEFVHQGGTWTFDILAATCYPYNDDWKKKLSEATTASALDYQLLHAAYGHYLGKEVNRFIEENQLHYQAALIASHGHTTFHLPPNMTAQLGDGAAIAAETGLPVVTDLRALDVAFGGQGAPIVPIGEKLLLKDYQLYLNLGGIANITYRQNDAYIAFDICPANRVLNMVAATRGVEYDDGGRLAAAGSTNEALLQQLNALPYYQQAFPKSLANSFGVDEIYPLLNVTALSANDQLSTYTTHIVQQIANAVAASQIRNGKLLVTGGGAFNSFLIERLELALQPYGIEVIVPDEKLVQYKEAAIMAFIGVLRWRQENNVLASVTGAKRDSIGGAVWIGQEA